MNSMLNIFKSFLYHLKESVLSPLPFRVYWTSILMGKLKIGTFKQRLDMDAVIYPGYAYSMYNSALQAKALGIRKISAIEFGVATGHGLLAMEQHAREIEKELGIEYEVFGFDMGTGLPKPTDYKDQGYFWAESSFEMNEERLRSTLHSAKLIMGDVDFTIEEFMQKEKSSPIGFISFDLDFYSSTLASFKIFSFNENMFLPRVECFMDDVCSTELLIASKGTGVLKAIIDFNETSKTFKKILKKEGVSFLRRFRSNWHDKIYVFHNFNHPKYSESVIKIQKTSQI